jgi:hypothetical protein
VPFFLHRVTQDRWLWGEDVPCLPPGELQSEVFLDLQAKDNVLSVWQITDDESNMDRVLAALAANRDDVSHFDYMLIDQQLVTAMNIGVLSSPGDTRDALANSWHRDLGKLSASQLLAIAYLLRRQGRLVRCPKKRVHTLLETALSSGHILFDQLNDGIKRKLGGAKPGE